ncbi:DNA-binding CsgD family transcriptional regulator/PAS domain-containing protein [Aminobacter niigataensis]|uniref:DNA-binding CsgD family transcriptional regulator/PAS domain-containing protein n=1 Tax=Aminobacter niigataensis TaxID=83265 RepID=A0ABR6KZ88_9HYPH|nr:hypothetical protein [Aminobacter niigataensis]MBB4649852.1 DNA-binding CsgD family transcriptional regulator/PAS domain-containing protein [Aminobacter niigataensis]
MSSITLEDFNNLVHSVYQAGLDPREWSLFVENLAGFLGGTIVCLQAHDAVASAGLGLVSSKTDPDFLSAYDAYYAAKNVWAPGLAKASTGKVVQSEQLYDRDEFFRTEFYNDYFSTQGLVAASAIVLHNAPDRLLFLSGNIRCKEAEWVRAPLSRLLDLLGPHISRSFDLLRHVPTLVNGEDYRATAQLADDAMFFIDRSGRITYSNRAGDALRRENTIIRVDRAGYMHLLDLEADAALQAALGAMARANYAQLQRDFVVRCATGSPLQAILAPVRHNAKSLMFDCLFEDHPVAMLVFHRQTECANSDVPSLDRYGMTPAELALAKAIAEGISPREYADIRSISINTVRTQLKSIYAKTETSRQSQLAVLIAREHPRL